MTFPKENTCQQYYRKVLKYASYCSTLNKEQKRNIYQEFLDKEKFGEKAEESLADFFEQEYEDVSLNKR